MTRLDVEKDYFEWMVELVCNNRFAKNRSYRRLLSYLHNIEFTYDVVNDADRAHDGTSLRHRYALRFLPGDYDFIKRSLRGPCSILEMMVALVIRCEESIMSDPRMGDRTGQWFWKMITNLGLGAMSDENWDRQYVDFVIDRFLSRDYEPDGRGGLFSIRNSEYDFRDLEIWHQLNYFLDTVVDYSV